MISYHLHQGPQPYAQYQSWTSLRFEATWEDFLKGCHFHVLEKHIAMMCTEMLKCSHSGPNQHWMAYGMGSQTTWKSEDLFATLVLALAIWDYRLNPSIQECWWTCKGLKVKWRLGKNIQRHPTTIKINKRRCCYLFYCSLFVCLTCFRFRRSLSDVCKSLGPGMWWLYVASLFGFHRIQPRNSLSKPLPLCRHDFASDCECG